MFFESWESLARTAVSAVVAYVAVVVVLRFSGKRTLSKMNAFDFVVTIALGSTLSATIVSKDVALADGVLAIFLLIALQFAVASLIVRSKFAQRLVKSSPQELFAEGGYREEDMRRERITADEVLAAVRRHGMAELSDVHSVILETDGSFSVISRQAAGSAEPHSRES